MYNICELSGLEYNISIVINRFLSKTRIIQYSFVMLYTHTHTHTHTHILVDEKNPKLF
jgi:hypothetical protein